MFGFLKRKPKPVVRIVVDDRGVRRDLGDGRVEDVAWTELSEVEIVTTDEGPYVEDVFFLLTKEGGGGCVVPQNAPESDALLERLGKLPGFDYGKVIEAMGSAENARFVCWRKS